jgi:peptidoglycan biosynthesis protein MviN/MurJ (putative lipid II flippase)
MVTWRDDGDGVLAQSAENHVNAVAYGLWRMGQTIAHSQCEEHQKMPLLNLVVVLVVVGVALYLINRYIPMASSIKSILNVVVVICVCVWLLQVVGLWGNVTSFRLPH